MKIIRVEKQLTTTNEVVICEKTYLKGRVRFQKIFIRSDQSLFWYYPSGKMVTRFKKIVELDELYDKYTQSLI